MDNQTFLYSSSSAQESGIVEEKRDVDILSSLFKDVNTASNPALTINAELHSINVCQSGSAQLSSICAGVYNDKLIAIVKSVHQTVLNVFCTSSLAELDGQRVPTFFRPPLFSQVLCSNNASCLSSQMLEPIPAPVVLAYRPALIVLSRAPLQSSATSIACPVSPIADDLFQQLFGLEFSLARSAVALVGSENGSVLFFDTRSYCNPSSSPDTTVSSNTLCCLDQPVLTIHALHLPSPSAIEQMEVDPPRNDSLPSSTTSNALVCIGRMGKLVLISQAGKNTGVPQFTEYDVPGPILSSVYVQQRCIAYSTPSGVYRLCLEPECVSKSSRNVPSGRNSSLIVPDLQFRFPSQVSSSHLSFIINSQPSSEGCTVTVTSIALSGKVSSVCMKPCRQVREPVEGVEAGRDMKQSLKAIQYTSEQTMTVQGQLKEVNSALVDINKAMVLLRMQLQPSGQPFSCTIHPIIERVGIEYFNASVKVTLLYCGVDTLKKGWTLLLNTQCTSTTRSKSTTIALECLTTNGCIEHRVMLEPVSNEPFTFTITASLFYSTTHHPTFNQPHSSAPVQQTPANSSGFSIPLSTCIVDALDFVQPSQDLPLQLLQQATHLPAVSTLPDQTLHYSLEIPLPLQEGSHLSGSQSSGQKCTDVLNSLLPTTVVEVATAAIVNRSNSSQIEVRSYDGSSIKLKVTSEGSRFKLNVRTSRASCMVELFSSLQRRIVRNQKKLSGEKRKETSSELLTGEHVALKVRDQINTCGVFRPFCVIKCTQFSANNSVHFLPFPLHLCMVHRSCP